MIDEANLRRELEKIRSTLQLVDVHLSNKDGMNAALHMSSEIRSTPLSSAVKRDIDNLDLLIQELS